jgi:DNA ligase-1
VVSVQFGNSAAQYDHITTALLSAGLESLSSLVPLTIGIPLSPMLGSITRSLGEVFTRLPGLAFTSEAKLDGQRAQLHARVVRREEEEQVRKLVGKGGWWGDLPEVGDADGDQWRKGGGDVREQKRVFVRLFSRHLEDMTEKVRLPYLDLALR